MALEQRERDVVVTPVESSASAGMGVVLAVLVLLALGAIIYFWSAGNQPSSTTHIQHDTIVVPGGSSNSGPATPPSVPGEAPHTMPSTPPSVPGEPAPESSH